MNAFQQPKKNKSRGSTTLRKLLNATNSGCPSRGSLGLKLESLSADSPPPLDAPSSPSRPSISLLRGKSFSSTSGSFKKSKSNSISCATSSRSRKLSLGVFSLRRQTKTGRRRSSSSKNTAATSRSWHGSMPSLTPITSSSFHGASVGPDSRCIRFINLGRWEALRSYLETDAGYSDAVRAIHLSRGSLKKPRNISASCHGSRRVSTISSQPILIHLALKQYPPLDIIETIVGIMKSIAFRDDYNPMETLDASGRSPLHTAAAWGASPHVVRFLVRQDPTATMLVDQEGKTPLHLSCENCCFEGSCDDGSRKMDGDLTLVKGPMLSVLNVLAKAGPEAIHTEDDMDMLPLEYAILNGANVSAVKLLQKLSVTEWKKTEREEASKCSVIKSNPKIGVEPAAATAQAGVSNRRGSGSSNCSLSEDPRAAALQIAAARVASDCPLRQNSTSNAAA